MKKCVVALFFLFTTPIFGQSTVEKSLQRIESLDNAQQFIHNNPTLKPILLTLNSHHDTSLVDMNLYKRKKGDVVMINGSSYKIIEDTVRCAFRASYIYLDGSRLSSSAIDSLRAEILTKYTAGVLFETLVDQYTMDGNQKHGDTGPFEAGVMVSEFEEAVRQHATGTIFTVDVPANQWYYVVKKTADNQISKEMTVLKVASK